jgi:hypothetical protein
LPYATEAVTIRRALGAGHEYELGFSLSLLGAVLRYQNAGRKRKPRFSKWRRSMSGCAVRRAPRRAPRPGNS